MAKQDNPKPAPPETPDRILVVDDAPNTLEIIRRNLLSRGYRVFTAPDVAEAMTLLDTTPIDLVVTDIKMPRISGHELVRHVRDNLGDTDVIVITGYPSVEGAVRAVKTGAEEYLPKPFTDEELFAVVQKALEGLKHRRVLRKRVEKDVAAHYGIIARSAAMRKVFATIKKAAATSATVLITGESGTGKELAARAIHYTGSRVSAPFVPVNCGGIPETLLESELFGYVKGAFTGANESRAGFFQTADGGTIFLDEISETTPPMQVKLLRVLQEKKVCMIGSRQERKVNVRILAATNKDLAQSAEAGKFREDLYYRLNVINLDIPPLRQRGEDIPLLARHFADKFAAEADRSPVQFTDRVLDVFRSYPWPGNVREMENIIQRLVIMIEGDTIDSPDLPPAMRYPATPGRGAHRTLAEVETEYIRNVLASVKDNKTAAARILGIDRKTLREKLKHIGA